MGRLLDSYDRLQASPFGSLSDSNPGMRQLKSQRGAITSALRKGISNARKKGDAAGVLANIGVANAYGVQATGIGSAELRVAGDEEYAVNTEKQAAMNEDLANRAADGVNQIGAAASTNPDGSPTAGASFAARLSLDDRARAKTREKTLAGDFGTGAQDRARRDETNTLADSVVSGKTDMAPATRRAVELGGNAYTLNDAVKRKQQSALAAEIRSGVAAGKETDMDVTDGWTKRANELGVGDKAAGLIDRERKKRNA